MDPYAVIAFVHVAGAVALLSGSAVGSPAVRAAVRRAQTRQELRADLTLGRGLLVLDPASALVVLASGIYLTSAGDFWTLGWVRVAGAFWIVNSVVAGAVLKPILGRIRESAKIGDGPVEQSLNALRWSRRWSFAGDLLLANDVAALYIMVIKPDLSASLLTVAAANLVVVFARAVRGGYRSARAVSIPASL